MANIVRAKCIRASPLPDFAMKKALIFMLHTASF